MGSESLHAPRERISRRTLTIHHAIVSIKEELDAVDWYQQRADDCEDEELKEILLHNMREEIEHAAMALEWLRRYSPDVDEQFRTYLFTEGPIMEIEEEAEHEEALEDLGLDPAAAKGGVARPAEPEGKARPARARRATIGSLKAKGKD
ncbi:hypothetical protein C882_1934 [Caenispirillum salinarum AK4]|uniref:Ferritin n=1 Tax=Caenispirillum salinarum AK4 TaxID=1238182 RepID=K9GLW9_9PROT|nr:ferritin-like domain-containing protein [Caenispirillum salinarum]EKV27005.1 hypothetical protein C882_1934 [Caenispirillum salinarum AK4]